MVKDISVIADVEHLLSEWHEVLPELRFLPVDGETAASRMAEGLQVSDEYGPEGPMNEDFHSLRALAKARLSRLPAAHRGPLREPLEVAARQALVRDFFSSPEATAVGHLDQADLIASRLVDYRSDYGDGYTLRWSPTVVELCLCDWYPRKVAVDEAEIGQIAAVLRAWVCYAGRRRGLAAALVEETPAGKPLLGCVSPLHEETNPGCPTPSQPPDLRLNVQRSEVKDLTVAGAVRRPLVIRLDRRRGAAYRR